MTIKANVITPLDEWREAEHEATRAYEHWCANRGRDAYRHYRAAQDRADAAQDALANHAT